MVGEIIMSRFVRKWIDPTKSYILDTETGKKYYPTNPKGMLELFNLLTSEIEHYKKDYQEDKLLDQINLLTSLNEELRKHSQQVSKENTRLREELTNINKDLMSGGYPLILCPLCGGELEYSRSVGYPFSDQLYYDGYLQQVNRTRGNINGKLSALRNLLYG